VVVVVEEEEEEEEEEEAAGTEFTKFDIIQLLNFILTLHVCKRIFFGEDVRDTEIFIWSNYRIFRSVTRCLTEMFENFLRFIGRLGSAKFGWKYSLWLDSKAVAEGLGRHI
jgi:hypothetical protein